MLCIIVGSLPYNIKHLEVTVSVIWYYINKISGIELKLNRVDLNFHSHKQLGNAHLEEHLNQKIATVVVGVFLQWQQGVVKSK